MDKNNIQNQIDILESQMNNVDFWNDKIKAQEIISKIKELKSELQGENVLDNGSAIFINP